MDYSNEGVLYFNDSGDGQLIALQLKTGLIDSEIRLAYSSTPGYDRLDRSKLYDSTYHLQIISKKNGTIVDLPENSHNPSYLYRKNLVKYRAPLIEQLVNTIRFQARTCSPDPWIGFENNMQYVISECDPDKEIWHNSILEYSHINDIEPKYAYREIKLQIDNISSFKMRIYSFFKKFMFDINNVTDEQSAMQVRKNMNDKFFRDSWV